MTFATMCLDTACKLRGFWADESGASAIEYALVASGVGAAIAATVWQLGSGVKGFYQALADMLPN
jgi:pilus assembly protein Flp/PilA